MRYHSRARLLKPTYPRATIPTNRIPIITLLHPPNNPIPTHNNPTFPLFTNKRPLPTPRTHRRIPHILTRLTISYSEGALGLDLACG